MDIWDENKNKSADERSIVIGTAFVSGICSNYQYSIVEYAGFNYIPVNAHELGHR
jgi:hypothetical protein